MVPVRLRKQAHKRKAGRGRLPARDSGGPGLALQGTRRPAARRLHHRGIGYRAAGPGGSARDLRGARRRVRRRRLRPRDQVQDLLDASTGAYLWVIGRCRLFGGEARGLLPLARQGAGGCDRRSVRPGGLSAARRCGCTPGVRGGGASNGGGGRSPSADPHGPRAPALEADGDRVAGVQRGQPLGRGRRGGREQSAAVHVGNHAARGAEWDHPP
jgi:hypothetical protein